jgi:hypothetical protein
MKKLAVERIRNLLVPALIQCREAKFQSLAFILEVALAALSEIKQELATEKMSHRVPIPVTKDRPPDVIGGWNWDIVNKVVHADPDVAVIYNVTAEAAERGVPEGEFGAAIYPEDMPKVSYAVHYTLGEGGGFSVVYRLIQADKSLKTVLAIGRAIFKNGTPVNFKGTIIDVTEDDARRERGMKYRIPEALDKRALG